MLNLLLRQAGVKCRLCRLGIQHPSVRRAALLLLAARDEGVDLWAAVNGVNAARSLPTFPDRSVDDLDFLAYEGIRFNLSLRDPDARLLMFAGLD